MKSDRPTMRDVADAAGASLKTVSRVVNGERGVRPATAARVEAAIRQLKYRPNDLARGLRHGKAPAAVGLVIGDVSNPFYSTIARAVEIRARRSGSVLVAVSSDEDPAKERDGVEILLGRRVGGLLVVPTAGDHDWLVDEMRLGVHVVFLDRPAGQIAADTVVFDNAGGGAMAVRHLLAHGYRRIAIVGDPPSLYTISERYRGYVAALSDAGLEVDPQLVRLGPHDADAAARAVTELLALPDPPDAIFTCNNRMTIGALNALRAAGDARVKASDSEPAGGDARVKASDSEPAGGDQIAIVGFDDFELADLLGVTVVAASPAEMGQQGADLLFARLDGDDRPPQRIVLPPRLVPRGSGERVPGVMT